MKQIFFLLSFFIASVALEAQTHKLDSSQSKIEWLGRKVTGKHHGNISFLSGELTKEGDSFVSGEFLVDMKSITNIDLTDPDVNAQLVGHLKSDDFFDVEKFPVAKLVITEGTLLDDGKHEFVGHLTIKENTEPFKFIARINTSNEQHVFTGKLTIDRSKFDVRYGSGSFFENLGDNLIYDKFDLDFIATFKE